MTITYPLAFPTTFGMSDFTMGIDHAVGVSESEFDFSQEVQEHDGVAWVISGSLNLLNREQAAEYNAFVAALHGRKGTFTLSPPGQGTPRGTATGTPLVKGADQTGNVLVTDGWTAGVTGILKVGDLFQLGSGATATLHMVVVADVDSDGSGNATITFAPKIVTAPADNAAITVSNPVGHFRMSSNLTPVSIQPPNTHSIRFSATQAQ